MTKALEKFLLSEDKRGYTKEYQRTNHNRITTRGEAALKELSIIAEKMPMKYVERIFNSSNLEPFFKAVFNASKNMTPESKNRLLITIQVLINIINYDLAPHLAPELYALLKDARIETDMIGIKSLNLTRRGYEVKKT